MNTDNKLELHIMVEYTSHKLAEINPNFKKIQFRSTKYTPYIYA